MYYPSLEEVKGMTGQGNLVPLYRAVQADLETPVSAYLKVARPPYSFLLESVEGGERLGRYSFIGTEPYKVVKTGPGQLGGEVDPLIPVEEEMNRYKLVPVPELPRFHGGGVGYLAYDTVSYFEPRVPMMPKDPQGLPQSVFMFADTLLVFDHLRHDIKVVSHVRLEGDVTAAYAEATAKIDRLVERLAQPLSAPTLPVNASKGRPRLLGFLFQLHPGGVRGSGEAMHRLHLRWRLHPGGELPEVQPPNGSAAV